MHLGRNKPRNGQNKRLSVRNDGETGSIYGSDLDVVAPGTGIKTSLLGGGSVTYDGTSFSVGVVAAQVALLSTLLSLP